MYPSHVTTNTIKIQNGVLTPECPRPSVIHTVCHPQPLAATNLTSVPTILSFPEYSINGIVKYVAFCVWLVPLIKMLPFLKKIKLKSKPKIYLLYCPTFMFF